MVSETTMMSAALKQIPGDKGFPLIGHTLAFVRNPRALATSRFNQYGEVARVSILGKKGVFLLSPDANEFLTVDKDKQFSSKAAYEPFLKDTFPDALGLMDFDDHAHHRKIMQAAFKKEAMMSYMGVLNQSAADTIATWDVTQPFLFFPHIKSLLFNQAAIVFMGESLGPVATQLIGYFTTTVAGTVAMLRLLIPGTAFYKAVKSSLALRQYLIDKIPEKRQALSADLFSQLCFAKSEDGEQFTDQQIAKHMLGLMSAAHETTSSAIYSMAYALAKYPDVQQRVYDEIAAINTDNLSYDDLALPYTTQVYYECLRMWGSSHTMPRMALRDLSYKGFAIPAGTMVYISPSFVHYMDKYWTQPETFDPERFSEQRKEQKQHRYVFMPFGGGAHKCIGMHFAEMQIKVFFFNLLKQYRLSLSHPDYTLKVKYTPVPEPADGLPLVLTRI